MATGNPFDLLEDDDTEDLSTLISVQKQKAETKKTAPPSSVEVAAAKLPSKPLPPAQAVREAKTESSRGGRGGGRVYGRGRGRVSVHEPRKDSPEENAYSNKEMSGARTVAGGPETERPFERRGGYGGPRGPYRGGFSNGDKVEGERERPRRTFDRRSGTGRGNETKREGAGRGNWGTQTDEPAPVSEDVVNEGEKIMDAEKPSKEADPAVGGDMEASADEIIEKEPEDKEMTLEEYEKVLEEKRKGLQALKTEERKVDAKEFKAMQPLANKKSNADIFIKLGSEKDKKKESSEKEEKSKKSVSINEFLKPAEGERYHGSSSRGRGRGRGPRGGYSGGYDTNSMKAPSIEDPGQFPILGGK